MRTFLFKTANDIWFSFQTENMEPNYAYEDEDVCGEVVTMFVEKMVKDNPPKTKEQLEDVVEEAAYIFHWFICEYFETSFIPDDARPIETLLTEFPI
ncbi:hypothetical protein ACQKJG_18280 [Priestia megaterium]|uniref:hypothetical protein n=1 Tax=Priestia megaterium TaxID=1404 RepID=UPI003CFEDE05